MVSEILDPNLRDRDALEQLLNDDLERKAHFPVTSESIYLAHAAVCPLPAVVRDAVVRYASRAARLGQFQHLHRDLEEETRVLSADLMGVSANEIAFTSSTSAGLSMIARGLDLGPGDSVVVYGGDFPSNILPWIDLRYRGVDVRIISSDPSGAFSVEQVMNLIDDSTRLVALSSANFCTGALLPLRALAKELSSSDVRICVDAIQTLGAVDIGFDCADFAVADAHKWLLGPQGIALMYVRKDLQHRLKPTQLGWKSLAEPGNYRNLSQELAAGARRYEPGSLNVLGIVGLHAALKLLTNIGITHIWQRIASLTDRLDAGLRDIKCTVFGPGEKERQGPMRAFVTQRPVRETAAILDEHRIVVSVRSIATGDDCLRVAPHFYNTTEEIDELLSVVENAERSRGCLT